MMRPTGRIIWSMVWATVLLGGSPAAGQEPERARAADHATVSGDRSSAGSLSPPSESQVVGPGMTRSGTVLLPNGWSLRPAGHQTRLGVFPVQISPHPTAAVLAILHAGYGNHEVLTVDGKTGRVIGRVSL